MSYDYDDESEELAALAKKSSNTIEFNREKKEMPDFLRGFFNEEQEDEGMKFVDNFTIL